MRHEFCFDHCTGFMILATSAPQNRINLVDEDDGRLKFPGKTENCRDQFVAVTVPFLGQSADVQIDKASTGFTGEGFREHGLTAARRAIEEDTLRCGEERGGSGIEVGSMRVLVTTGTQDCSMEDSNSRSEWVDDRFS